MGSQSLVFQVLKNHVLVEEVFGTLIELELANKRVYFKLLRWFSHAVVAGRDNLNSHLFWLHVRDVAFLVFFDWAACRDHERLFNNELVERELLRLGLSKLSPGNTILDCLTCIVCNP